MSNINSQKVEHIIVLVHGIRTFGDWQDEAQKFFEKDSRFKAYPVRYGYFNLFSFLLPFDNLRKKAADKIVEDIITNRRKHPEAKLSIISHSFGTYNVSRILFSQTELDDDVHAVIMCGAIVPSDFPWHLLRSRIKGGIRNDFSFLDPWPAIAEAITFGYGAIGTFGAQDADVLDIRHEKGHSDYFSESTYEAWKIFIEKNDIYSSHLSPSNNIRWFSRLLKNYFACNKPITQAFLSIIAKIKWLLLPLFLTLAIFLMHPPIFPDPPNNIEGRWNGTIYWNNDFAIKSIITNAKFDVNDPISTGNIFFYLDKEANRWKGFSTWQLQANGKEIAKLAVEPKNISIQDKGNSISFDMHAFCRQQTDEDFVYGGFSEYRISLNKNTNSDYEGSMLRKNPKTNAFETVGSVVFLNEP